MATSDGIVKQRSLTQKVLGDERGSRVERAVEEWFSSGHVELRSDETIAREQYTFFASWSGKYSRFMAILPTLLTQIAIGSLYSWSVFNKSMDAIWGTSGQNANAFTICVAFFGFTTIFFGNWIERNGPFASVLRTLFLTPMGWGFACLGSYLAQVQGDKANGLWIVYAGFGMCQGFGAGFSYISTASMIQKWFPEFKGLATGVAVMGFGVGSFIWTTIAKALLDVKGDYKYASWQVQGIFAAIYFGILLVSLPFMRNPPPGFVPSTQQWAEEKSLRGACIRTFATVKQSRTFVTDKFFTFNEAINTLEFRCLVVLVFGQFIAGVVFLSSAADMVQNVFGKDANEANFITSMLNLCNFTGRVFWGYLSDKIGRKTFYLGSTATQAFALGLMSVWVDTNNYGAWLLSFLVIGSLYGGGFGVLPAFMSDMFGPKISAATHGVGIAVWALSSIIGIPVFTYYTGSYYKVTCAGAKVALPKAYIYNSYWLCGLPVVAFCACLLMNVKPIDRNLRQHNNDLRIRIFAWVVVISKAGLSLRSNEQIEAEYAEWHKTQPAKIEKTVSASGSSALYSHGAGAAKILPADSQTAADEPGPAGDNSNDNSVNGDVEAPSVAPTRAVSMRAGETAA